MGLARGRRNCPVVGVARAVIDLSAKHSSLNGIYRPSFIFIGQGEPGGCAAADFAGAVLKRVVARAKVAPAKGGAVSKE